VLDLQRRHANAVVPHVVRAELRRHVDRTHRSRRHHLRLRLDRRLDLQQDGGKIRIRRHNKTRFQQGGF